MKITNAVTGSINATAMRSGLVAPTFDLVTGGVRPKADAATAPGDPTWSPPLM